MLLHGEGEIRTAFHGGIVGDDHAGDPLHDADAGNHSSSRTHAVVETGGSELSNFEEGRTRINYLRDTVSHEEFAAVAVFF